MGIVAGLGAAAAATSIASGINSATSGGPSYGGAGGGAPYVYQPTGQAQQDQNLQSNLNDMQAYASRIPQMNTPYFQEIAGHFLNNPYAAGAQTGANTAANTASGTVVPYELGGAAALYGAGAPALKYGTQLLNTGFDPQNALYNRTQQQVADQANAEASMFGLQRSPAGAGVVNKTLSDFNIDWQNAQEQRQLAALQGYGGAVNTAGRAFGGAADLGTTAYRTQAEAANLPYAIYLQQQQDALTGLSGAQSGEFNAYQLPQQTAVDQLAYLGRGQSAAGNALQAQGQYFNQGQQTGQNIGQGLSQLSAIFGPGGGGGGTTPYAAGINYAGVDPSSYYYGGDTSLGTGTFGGGGY